MDPKELDLKIKQFVDNLSESDDYDKMFSEINDAASNLQDETEHQSSDFKFGYDAGFVDGFEEGRMVSNFDTDSIAYNSAIDHILEIISHFEFDNKQEVVDLVDKLRKQ